MILDDLNWRSAIKKFDPDKMIEPNTWSLLQEVMRLTPSSYGLQPWKFIHVHSPAVRKQLREFSRDQAQVTDCSHFLVLTYLEKITLQDVDRHILNMSRVRGKDVESFAGYRKSVTENLLQGRRSKELDRWAERQTYIVMGQVMAVAAQLRIDTCPMEGIEPLAYDQLLNLRGSGYKTVAALAFGFRADNDQSSKNKKVRFSRADLFSKI